MYLCFTCKKYYTLETLEDHPNSSFHKACTNELIPSTSQAASTSQALTYEQCKEIILRLKEFQDASVEINIKHKSALCGKCRYYPKFNAKAIADHIELHEITDSDTDSVTSSTSEYDLNEAEVVFIDYGRVRSELAKFGRQHFIKLVDRSTKGYCSICDNKIAAHIKNFKQHIRGSRHKGLVKLKNGIPPKKCGEYEYETKSLREYIETVQYIQQFNTQWINKKFCVNKYGYMMILPVPKNGLLSHCKCFLCDIILLISQIETHCKTEEHEKKFFEVPCVTTFAIEFIREVCNINNLLLFQIYL